MNSKDISITKKNELKQIISKNKLENLKSEHFFEKISNNLSKKNFLKLLNIIKNFNKD